MTLKKGPALGSPALKCRQISSEKWRVRAGQGDPWVAGHKAILGPCEKGNFGYMFDVIGK